MDIDVKQIIYENFVKKRMNFDSFSSYIHCEKVADEIASQLTKKQRARFYEYKIFIDSYHEQRYAELIDYTFDFFKSLMT